VLTRLEAHEVYRSSFGSVPMRRALEGGMLLYPGEHPGEKRLQLSLLRFVTSVLSNEVIGLWFDTDQMLSLLGGAVDNAERLAVVFRALYVWTVVDEASIAPPTEWMRVSCRASEGKAEGWELLVGAAGAEPVPKWRKYFTRTGLFSSLEYIASGLHVANTPSFIMNICKTRTEGIRCLLDSTPEEASDELIVSHLAFLLRTPFVLEDLQRLDYVVNAIADSINDDDGAANGATGEDYEIHLNRFTDPPVWVEAVLQQLILNKDRLLTRSRLTVLYQGEAGIGPGPLKEFLEMCRILFGPDYISNSSLTDMMAATSATEGVVVDQSDEQMSRVSATDSANIVKSALAQRRVGSVIGRPRPRPAFADLPLTSLFPLFRPAGESSPESVVPLELEEVADRASCLDSEEGEGDVTVTTDATGIATGTAGSGAESAAAGKEKKAGGRGRRNGGGGGEGKNPKESQPSRKQALRAARLMFESVGVLLGYSILNCCPIGVGLPATVWTLLLKQEIDSLGNPISRKPRSLISWQQLCGEDAATLRSCALILNDLSDSELRDMDMSFVGSRHIWEPATHSLRLQEVELVPGGADMPVTVTNRHRYVDLYTRVRYLSRGMEESIECMRRGLLRVIPQALLNVLSAEHISGFIRGDATLNLDSLRGHVLYENGFSPGHRVVKLFWHLLEHEMSEADKRALLLFWTGNSIPPHGGFGGDGGDYEEVRINIPCVLMMK
jgi:hypothetical protein